jgi:hypothetical protein
VLISISVGGGLPETAGLCLPPGRQRSVGRPPLCGHPGEDPRLRSRAEPRQQEFAYRAPCRATAGRGMLASPACDHVALLTLEFLLRLGLSSRAKVLDIKEKWGRQCG